jgi:hypothetical protein
VRLAGRPGPPTKLSKECLPARNGQFCCRGNRVPGALPCAVGQVIPESFDQRPDRLPVGRRAPLKLDQTMASSPLLLDRHEMEQAPGLFVEILPQQAEPSGDRRVRDLSSGPSR